MRTTLTINVLITFSAPANVESNENALCVEMITDILCRKGRRDNYFTKEETEARVRNVPSRQLTTDGVRFCWHLGSRTWINDSSLLSLGKEDVELQTRKVRSSLGGKITRRGDNWLECFWMIKN